MDMTLAAMARNIFMSLSSLDVDLVVVHILGKNNPIADALSRWNLGSHFQDKFHSLVDSPVWFYPSFQVTDLDWSI